jgi:hypothetical protein
VLVENLTFLAITLIGAAAASDPSFSERVRAHGPFLGATHCLSQGRKKCEALGNTRVEDFAVWSDALPNERRISATSNSTYNEHAQ